MSERNVYATKCKCGHSWGAHAQGSHQHWRHQSIWACYAPGCECQLFETVEMRQLRVAYESGIEAEAMGGRS